MAENSAFPSSSSYRLSTQDATFIYGESQSGPLHIGSIGLFEGRVDFNGLLGHFEERMHLVPRYRQRLIEVPLNLAHAMMEDDPEFAIENHVHQHELPDAMGEGDALGEMMRVFQKPLDRKHPLWALHVFYNLDGNRTALMWKVHHCLVDGVSGVELLKVMYDFRAEPDDIPQPPEPWVAAKPSSLIRRMADALRESDSRRGERDDRRGGRGDRGSGVGGGARAAVGRGVAGDDGAGDAANRADAVEFDAGDAGPAW